MIVFKTFLKVLNKNKSPIILFTVMLVIFGALNFTSNESTTDFTSSKPDVLIVNNDVNEGVTESFIKYISDRSNIIELEDKEAIDDALFYRNVNYVIYIPEGFREDVISGKKPNIEVKSTGDYQASFASMMVNRYLRVLNLYSGYVNDEDELTSLVSNTLLKEVSVDVTSKLDSYSLSRLATYFNFMNYSMLAGLVYVVSLILTSFKNEKISKRTIISSMNYKSFNRYLLLSNGLFALILWVLYMILSYVLLGDILLSFHGLVCVVNSFVFTIVSLVIAIFIGNLINNKNAVNGIVNVVALGSSFLCGAFVPVEYMPEGVVNMGRVLPSYYYINSNEVIKTIEEFNIDSLMPVFKNILVMIIFTILFVVLINMVSKRKMKFA